MDELARWSVPAVAGAILGFIYFGGLWWTVRRSVSSRRPAALVLASFVVRIGFVTVGLALLARGDARRVLVALTAVLAVRAVLMHRARVDLAPTDRGSAWN